MIFCTPYIHGATDYEHLVKEIRRKGKMLNHVHLVVARAEDEEAAYAYGESLSDFFMKSLTVVIPEDTRNGNQLSVDLFRAATRFAFEYVAGEGELARPDSGGLLLQQRPDSLWQVHQGGAEVAHRPGGAE